MPNTNKDLIASLEAAVKELRLTETRLDVAIVRLPTFDGNGPGSCTDRLEAAVDGALKLIRDLQDTAANQARQLEKAEAVIRHYADTSNWRWCREHYEGGTDGTEIARKYFNSPGDRKVA